uniref:WD repeat-containing protein DWA2 n=1 Tax=Rhizophora mucronata TaxID=61149 RepID=A0A2P2JC66_RHIMU
MICTFLTRYELMQSCGTDSTVNLWFASTSAGDELPSESLVESPTQRVNPLLNTYSDFEDSVYGLAWSSREPWIFASLSYDGRVVVESVKPLLSKR